jgi:hypothetical protein
MELASYHPSGTLNLDVASEDLEEVWMLGIDSVGMWWQVGTHHGRCYENLRFELFFYSIVYWTLIGLVHCCIVSHVIVCVSFNLF